MVLAFYTSSNVSKYLYEDSWRYLERFLSYRTDTTISQNLLFIPKIRNPELRFLRSSRCLMLLYICVKFHENISKGFGVTEQTRLYHREMLLIDADGIANSVDPDQTALEELGLHSLPRPIWRRIIMVVDTVMILSFWADRSGKHVNLIKVYPVWNSVCIFWTLYSTIKPPCSNFRVITANLLGVQIFRNFTIKAIHTYGKIKDLPFLVFPDVLTILGPSLAVIFSPVPVFSSYPPL